MIIRQKSQSELQHLNGYMVDLAETLKKEAPYNRTIYEMCKSQFKKKPFKQLEIEEVWDEVQKAGKLKNV